MATLCVVIPAYNEKDPLPRVIERVRTAPLPAGVTMRVIVVDDGSADGTTEALQRLTQQFADVRAFYQSPNRGKGAALRRGFALAESDIVLVQDADLTYDPRDYPAMLAPILDGRADVVLGTRRFGATRRVLSFHRAVSDRALTTLSNVLTNLNLTDAACGCRAFRREVLRRIVVEEDRFGVDVELAAKVARLGVRVYEVPVTYAGRTYAEGRKPTWRDEWRSWWCVLRYNLGAHRSPASDAEPG